MSTKQTTQKPSAAVNQQAVENIKQYISEAPPSKEMAKRISDWLTQSWLVFDILTEAQYNELTALIKPIREEKTFFSEAQNANN